MHRHILLKRQLFFESKTSAAIVAYKSRNFLWPLGRPDVVANNSSNMFSRAMQRGRLVG